MLSMALKVHRKRSRDTLPVTKQYDLEEINEIVRGYMKNGVYYPAKGEIVKKELYNCLVDNEQKNKRE